MSGYKPKRPDRSIQALMPGVVIPPGEFVTGIRLTTPGKLVAVSLRLIGPAIVRVNYKLPGLAGRTQAARYETGAVVRKMYFTVILEGTEDIAVIVAAVGAPVTVDNVSVMEMDA